MIRSEIQAQRLENSVQLLAVSKTWPANILQQAIDAGQSHFGENYLQEALIKINALKERKLNWHFIGSIQSNKTKDIARYFDWVQSVDRLKIAQRLNAQRPRLLPALNVCLQVNIDNETTKSGILIKEACWLAREVELLDRLVLRGLMVIPNRANNINQQVSAFKQAHLLFSKLKANYPNIDTLSMGMTADLSIAIQEGSTMVRIGTGIFGQRHSLNK